VYTCLGIDDVQDIELTVRRRQEVLMGTTTVVQNDGLYALPSVSAQAWPRPSTR